MKQIFLFGIMVGGGALIVFVIGGLLFGQIINGATTAPITATISATNLAVSVDAGNIVYGSVALSTATSTGGGNGFTKTVTNDGSAMKLNVMSSNAVNGTTWTLGTSIGSDIFKHEVSTTTGSYMTFQATDTYLTASSSWPTGAANTQALNFRFTTPSASTDFVSKSITITVQAATP